MRNKKKSLIALAMICCLAIPTTAQAKDYEWWVLGSQTEIFGYLHNVSAYTWEAETQNITQNDLGVYVQIYATAGGEVMAGSVDTKGNWYSWSITARASKTNPEWWGSEHSTMYASDAYGSLYMYAR